jgi:hypothetical protein
MKHFDYLHPFFKPKLKIFKKVARHFHFFKIIFEKMKLWNKQH